MCGSGKRNQEPVYETTGGRRESYEGKTVQLSAIRDEPIGHACRPFGSPWWMLWMIWPAIMLVKFVVSGGSYLFSNVLSQPITVEITLLPVMLIGAGVFLLVRELRRRRD